MNIIAVIVARVHTHTHTSDLVNDRININKKIAIKPINI